MRYRKLVINGSLAVVVVTLAGLGYFTVASSSSAAPTAVRTATVAQGDVTAAVSASGNVTSAMNLGVSFTDCTGSLTTISVKPGQVVSQGQTLATVDPTKAQTALNNAQAQLTAVQPADYTGGGTIGDGVLPSSGSGGALTVTPAVYSVAAVPAVGSASVAADEAALLAAQNTYKEDLLSTSAVNVAVSNTKKSVTVDTAATAKAKQDLTTAESANPQVPSDISAAQAVLAQAQRQLNADTAALNSAEQLLTQTLTFDQQTIVYWQTQTTFDKGQGSAPSTPQPVAPTAAGSAAKSSGTAAASGSAGGSGSASSSGAASSSGKSSASTTGSSGSTTGGGAATATPSQTALNNAQQAVATAQQTLADCTLTAPVQGTVITVNGVVGAPPTSSATSSSSAGTSSSGAGGSTAAGGTASTGSTGGSSASATSSTSGFITLSDLGQMQIKGAFSESDVSSVQAGQSATVVFPALTDADDPAGITATGTVTSVDLSSVVTSNVVTYGVTVSLSSPSPRIKLGETGNVTVTTATQAGVLTAPTNAITTLGGTKTVTVQNGGSTQVVPVQVGIAGNGLTQISSGVSAGQKLVLPSPTSSNSTSGGFPRTGGGVSSGLGG